MLFVWPFVLDLVAVLRMTDDEKDLEIMLLRQQLSIVERKQARGSQIPRWQKVPLAALVMRMKDKASNAREALAESVRLFKPDTMIGWHQGTGPAQVDVQAVQKTRTSAHRQRTGRLDSAGRARQPDLRL
jgi:hypothetical protein